VDRANGTGRAQWLAELADALEQAQQIAWTLGVSEGSSPDARDLYGRLEAVRIEVESLRQGHWSRLPADYDPKWLGLAPNHLGTKD
jgi:hypothetical protein